LLDSLLQENSSHLYTVKFGQMVYSLFLYETDDTFHLISAAAII